MVHHDVKHMYRSLLLSLAVSDLGEGLLVQPLYVAILVMNVEENSYNTAYYTVYKAYYLIQKKLLVLAWYLGVFALTFDIFLAIDLHLRYQELVTRCCCCCDLSLGV